MSNIKESNANNSNKAYRNSLSNFATGICLITSKDKHGIDFGITINSFCSISLNPPIVSWSIGISNIYINAFKNGATFLLHILSSQQNHIANHFAKTAFSKDFSSIDYNIDDCLARFECKVIDSHIVGDHILLLSSVLHFDDFNADLTTDKKIEPLLFFASSMIQGF
jgi:flavin reductase (DIM6/NTAB) family NADH-FMN oxidoreductase RutF